MAAFAYELPSLRSGLQLNSAGGVVFPFRNVEPLQSWSELVFRDLEQAIEASKEKQKRTPLFLPQNTYKYVCKVFTNLREKLYLKQNYLVKSEFFWAMGYFLGSNNTERTVQTYKLILIFGRSEKGSKIIILPTLNKRVYPPPVFFFSPW